MLTEKKHVYKTTQKAAHSHQHTIISRKKQPFFWCFTKVLFISILYLFTP